MLMNVFQDQIFGAQVFYRALDSDSTGSSFPLYNPTVETPAEIGSMFNAISYDKVSENLLKWIVIFAE